MNTIIVILIGIFVPFIACLIVKKVRDNQKQEIENFYDKVIGVKGYVNTNLFCFVDENYAQVPAIKNFICSDFVISGHGLPKYVPCVIKGVFPSEDSNDNGTLYIKPCNVSDEEFEVLFVGDKKVLLSSEKYGEIVLKCLKFFKSPVVGQKVLLSAKFRNLYGYKHMWRISWSVN
ncbi:MAG: hypothetical protein IJF12_04355 [Alphaproteobacteria bacterium]|nr:hypothetical protein [Alphaproteobacteria bacterium]